MRIQESGFTSPLAVLNRREKEESVIYRTKICWMMRNEGGGGGGINRDSNVNEVRQELERLHVESMRDLGNMIISGATLSPMGVVENFQRFNESNGKYHETREKLQKMSKEEKKEVARQERRENRREADARFREEQERMGAYDRSSKD